MYVTDDGLLVLKIGIYLFKSDGIDALYAIEIHYLFMSEFDYFTVSS